MTNSKNSYSVSDLANLLQVPRTTVNDWLKKFDRYIDFEMRGRRKVYTDASLEVLQLISSARDRGTPLTDLEQELSQRCAVRPEISPLAQEENEETPAAKPVSAPPQQEENLPAVNFDFSGFLKELEIREKRRSHSGRRSFLLICVLLVLLLGVCCATLLLLGQLLTLKESSKTLAMRLEAAKNESVSLRKQTEKELKVISVQMEKNRLSETQAADALQKRLNSQRQQFEKLLSKLEKAEKLSEKELEKQEKENFRLKAELDSAVKLLAKKQDQLAALQTRENALTAENTKLKSEIAQLKKQLSAPVKTKKKAPAALQKETPKK